MSKIWDSDGNFGDVASIISLTRMVFSATWTMTTQTLRREKSPLENGSTDRSLAISNPADEACH